MPTTVLIFASLTGGAACALVIMMLRLGATPTSGRNMSGHPSPSEMRRFVLWRSFYVNPDDPRGWVPKMNGYGWTVNFRTHRNAAVFAALIAICSASAAALTAAGVLRAGAQHRRSSSHSTTRWLPSWTREASPTAPRIPRGGAYGLKTHAWRTPGTPASA